MNINFGFKYIMKKFYYVAICIATMLVTVIACDSKNEIPENERTICHYDEDLDDFFPITISYSDQDEHLNHGDKSQFQGYGDFTFHYKLEGENYPHTFIFSTLVPVGPGFTVYVYYPSYENFTYSYEIFVNFNEDGTFETDPFYSDFNFETHPLGIGFDTWTIKGTWDICDGFVSIESPWSITE